MSGEDVETQDEMPDDALIEMVTAPGTTRRWVRRVDGVNLIELDDLTLFRDLVPERRLMTLVLLLALKDRASAVDFEPGPFDSRQSEAFVGQVGLKLFYVVNDERLELVPPPAEYKEILTREILHLAGLGTWRRRVADIFRRLADAVDGQIPMPHQGHARLKCGEFQVDVEVLEYRTDHGPRLILNLSPQPDSLSERAEAVLKAIFDLRSEWRDPAQGDEPPA
jgi:hypothetical protein